MTPAEKLGFKIGKQYRVKEPGTYYTGDMIVKFTADDGSSWPLFEIVRGSTSCTWVGNTIYIDLTNLEEVQPEKGDQIMNKNNQQVLAQFFWDCGRAGEVSGVFICTKQQIEDALGKEVYFGEILGKHSEVYGLLDERDIAILSDDSKVIEVLLGVFPDGEISGYNPLSYIQETDEEEYDAGLDEKD